MQTQISVFLNQATTNFDRYVHKISFSHVKKKKKDNLQKLKGKKKERKKQKIITKRKQRREKKRDTTRVPRNESRGENIYL